jgi:hypothetical protein
MSGWRAPLRAQWVSVVVTTPQPDPSVVGSSVMAPGRSGGFWTSVGMVAATVVAKKVMDDAAIAKEAMDDAAVARKATDDAMVAKKAAIDAMAVKKVTVKMKATQEAAEDLVGSSSSPSPVAGVN